MKMMNPTADYAKLKFEAEQALVDMARKGSIGVVVVKPVAVFGRGDVRKLCPTDSRFDGVFPRWRREAQKHCLSGSCSERIDRIVGSFMSDDSVVSATEHLS
jgi:nucleoside-diphosphate-sugar epimerase